MVDSSSGPLKTNSSNGQSEILSVKHAHENPASKPLIYAASSHVDRADSSPRFTAYKSSAVSSDPKMYGYLMVIIILYPASPEE